MKRMGHTVITALAFGAAPSLTAQAQPEACAALADAALPDVRITAVEHVVPEDEAGAAHCKVSGVIGREIGFEVLLPDAWNGRFVMGGGGGFVGSIQNAASWTVTRGYATAGTDTGHRGSGIQAGWALDAPERQVNFGHLAVHRTSEVARALIRARYGTPSAYDYFMGCSRGGGQALMEAQRYPEDFDGIVSAAPAFDWTGLGAEMIQNVRALYPNPNDVDSPLLSPETLDLLEQRVLDRCDGLDGVRDGVMEDPRACPFILDEIPACADDRPGADCLTATQRAVVTEIYAPAILPDWTVVHPGQPFGGEGEVNGWQNWITGPNEGVLRGSGGRVPSLQFAFGTEIYKYFVFGDSSWSYADYDFSTWDEDTDFAAALLNAADPDLSAFAERGGRLILWHGWSDPALVAPATIEYYEQVEALDPDVRDYARLFLLPGVLHCGGGPGPTASSAVWLDAIVDWVEHGRAPERILATKTDADGNVVRTRPLCPYPQRAVYTGSGSTDEAASFVCREE